MISQIVRKRFCCETSVQLENQFSENSCVNSVHRQYHLEAPELHKVVPASEPCVTDVPCNWETSSQIIKMCYKHPVLVPTPLSSESERT